MMTKSKTAPRTDVEIRIKRATEMIDIQKSKIIQKKKMKFFPVAEQKPNK